MKVTADKKITVHIELTAKEADMLLSVLDCAHNMPKESLFISDLKRTLNTEVNGL